MTGEAVTGDIRSLLERTYHAALRAVSPAQLLRPHLGGPRPDLVLAFGKAALPMARAALAAHPGVPALVVVPSVTEDLSAPPGATVLRAAHPVPDERSVDAAGEALRRLGELREDHLALVLISGGGSALLAAPDGVTLAQKGALTRDLLRAGADIGELNAVRRHLSRVKGGRLAQATRARVHALLLSDVVGDDLSVIASGPTVPDPTTAADALAVLDRYRLLAPEARAHLASRSSVPPVHLPRATSQVIGSNRHLLEAARQVLEAGGVRAVILGDTFTGEARELAGFHASVARAVEALGSPVPAPVVLLSGGEATVTVRADGVGGRNQEFALALLLALGEWGLHALSAGSDGVDGPGAAAGAFLTPDSLARARRLGLDPRAFLARNDSGTFFGRLGDAFVTGPSGHNLNDFRALAVGL